MIRTFPLLVVVLLLAGCTKDLVCPQGQTECGGRCVSLLGDAANCGACGNACGGLELCIAGGCACRQGIETCDGTCTDLARDPANCGACGNACSGEQPLCGVAAELPAACNASCPEGLQACGGACVATDTDPYHCGACGRACPAGTTCSAGSCLAALQVACFNTSEVVPVTADLQPAGPARTTPGGPLSLALLGNAVYSANNWPSAGVSVIPLDPAAPVFTRTLEAVNQDVQHVGVAAGRVLVTNADAGTLVVLDAAATVLGEIPFENQQAKPNPKGFAVVGDTTYVALSGTGPASGQRIARVELSGLSTCAVGGAACGATAGEIDLLSVAGTSTAPGLPFPSLVLATGGKIYVTLANLEEECFAGMGCYYSKPAGSGKLAVIDPAAGDAVEIVDLGSGCWNPSGLAVHGSTLWVSCGAAFHQDIAPGALVPVSLDTSPPAVGTAVPLAPFVPGALAFCGGKGYVGDQATGDVIRFDPGTSSFETPVAVCPTGPFGFTTTSDIACPE